MYQPEQLDAASGSMAADLAAHAWNRQLTLYAGAGVSAAPPTSLPGASRLAELVASALEGQIPLDGVQRDDLIAVADAVSAQPQGPDLLRQTILGVANLLGARMNYAHEVLGLLLCEGVATIFETNYDDCIERAAQPERPTVVLTAAELLDSTGRALLKVHGCATQPRTMLVTQTELDNAPRWAQTRVAAQLGTDRVAFIGIGSPADYVRQSITAVLEDVGLGHLLLVDPSLARWDDDPPSEWRALLPALDTEQRDPRTAEEFCDALLRAYLHHPRREARRSVEGLALGHPQRSGVEAILETLEKRDGVWVLRWLRGASFRLRTGEPVAVSTQVVTGLLSVGALVGDGLPQRFAPNGWLFVALPSAGPNGPHAGTGTEQVNSPATPALTPEQVALATSPSQQRLGPVPVMLLLVHDFTLGPMVQDEALQRVIRARDDGVVEPGDLVVVVAVRHVGRMTTEVSVTPGDSLADVLSRGRERLYDSSPENVVADASSPRHLIDGPRTGPVIILNGEQLIQAA